MNKMVLRFSILALFALKSVQAGFFDFIDVEDPISLLWQQKDTIFGDRECLSSNGSPGLCQSRAFCLLSKGTWSNNQACSPFSICCTTESTTITRTNARVSSFTSGNNPRSTQYIVTVANNNICQMRLEFVSFTIAPTSEITDASGSFRRICQTDSMMIEPKTYNIPEFCGTNTGQHVYVHLNNEREVRLTVNLGSATLNRQWNIKVEQLECPGPQHGFTKSKTNNANNDFNLLAPIGAIQYFRDSSGQFSSFNANDAYLSGLNYAIAFRKTANTPCIDFTATYFRSKLIGDDVGDTVTDTNCADYVFVPGLSISDAAYDLVAKVCSAVNKKFIFSSTSPGPLYVYFVSATTYPVSAKSPVNYFNLQYRLRPC